jgi:hypothetical protein
MRRPVSKHDREVAGVVSNFLQHGQTRVLTFTAAPSTYTFVCDVHPKETTSTRRPETQRVKVVGCAGTPPSLRTDADDLRA